jgi:NAD(P)H-hydrate epimerase
MWDAHTIQHEPIASIDLMERACRAFVDWLVVRYDATQSILVVCGTGNNGGDGLGIARLLHEWGYRVRVWIVCGNSESADFTMNLKRLPEKVERHEIRTEVPPLADANVIIDAIFGSGIARPLSGIHERVIAFLNAASATRVAVDIPSGLLLDQPSSGTVFQADHTVTFQAPKLPFLFAEVAPFVGRWHVVEIGLRKEFLKQLPASYHFVTRRAIRKLVQPRERFSHKGVYGHALVMAGSVGKIGAAVLATRAALRAGAGLVTARVPRDGNVIMQTQVPEAMTSVDEHEGYLAAFPAAESFDVIGIGPGIGKSRDTARVLEQALTAGKPLVLDADALNLLAEHSALLHLVPPGSILTPHPKEFERLVGPSKDSFERLGRQVKLAQQLKSVVLVKGAYTAIATPEGTVYFNSTGNPAMAKGGSGDVLTGVLTGLLAQKYPATEAALLGVYWHGLAGDLAAHELGEYSVIASDLIDYLPAAFKKITA